MPCLPLLDKNRAAKPASLCIPPPITSCLVPAEALVSGAGPHSPASSQSKIKCACSAHALLLPRAASWPHGTCSRLMATSPTHRGCTQASLAGEQFEDSGAMPPLMLAEGRAPLPLRATHCRLVDTKDSLQPLPTGAHTSPERCFTNYLVDRWPHRAVASRQAMRHLRLAVVGCWRLLLGARPAGSASPLPAPLTVESTSKQRDGGARAQAPSCTGTHGGERR